MSTPTPPPPARLAQHSLRAWLVVVFVLAFGVVTDLASKHLAFERVAGVPVRPVRDEVVAAGPGRLHLLIPHHEPVVALPSILNFTLVYNPGAVFGIGAGKRWFFVLFTTAAVLAGLLYFARATRARDHAAHVGIALILSGGMGNLYDRLTFACVRDFIHPLPGLKLPWGLRWPFGGSNEVWPWISNLADLYLIIGVGIILILTLRAPRAPATPPAQP